MSAPEPILALNCGSSSIKFALFDARAAPLPRTPYRKGEIRGIGAARPEFEAGGETARPVALDPRQPGRAALDLILRHLRDDPQARGIVAVAHRVVHGGRKYAAPVRVDAEVLADLRAYVPLAPLHQPFALEAIDVLLASDPGLAQVACFDTAFHRTLPQEERMLPLPYAAWERGLCRYGFHGLSYEFLSTTLPERHGESARGRVIAAHLGSGASLCAMRGGASVATTMGFSALDGLMMGTRCGALDPGALLYMLESEGTTVKDLAHVLYRESGLLGVSGVSADPRELLPRETGDARVRAALALYVQRIVRETGALVALLGGLDLLAFTAGIGEHNAELRRRICARLGWLGIELDDDANAANAAVISATSSRVPVVVEPTNEEWIAARQAQALLAAGSDRRVSTHW